MMRIYVAAIVFMIARAAPAQTQDFKNATEMREILSELRQIRMLLEKNLDKPLSVVSTTTNVPVVTPSRTVSIDVGNNPMLGSKEAPITIVEFTDFQCPYCNRFYLDTFPMLKKNYIDEGRVRFFGMNLPLSIHRNALTAAQSARCADDQGGFWKMFDFMQRNPQDLEMTSLLSYAEKSGLNASMFRECVDSGKYKESIQESARQAENMGARATPAFIIGKSKPSGVDGVLILGAEDYSFFERILKGLE